MVNLDGDWYILRSESEMTSSRSTKRSGYRAIWLPAFSKVAEGRFRGISFAVLGVAFALSWPFGSHADPLEAGGLTFSDELGGFRLISASGSGRAGDPIVLVEEITGMGPAVLTIRRSGSTDTLPPSSGVLLRSLIKVVVNRSSWRWSGFDLELRNAKGEASVYSDGLSFDQISVVAEPLYSDLFTEAHSEDEPFDRLRFEAGRVKPDQTVRLAFNLTDINTRPIFFLAQQPIVLLADAAGPYSNRPPN